MWRENILEAVRYAVVLAAVFLVVHLCQRALCGPNMLSPLAALGFVLLAGMATGELVQLVGLPRLTGYMALGVLSGPFCFAFFGAEEVGSLSWMNELALGLIALTAGSELHVKQLVQGGRSLLWAVFFHALCIPVVMAGVFIALSPWLGLPAGLSFRSVVALSVVWGVLAMSKAPADTLAILKETGARHRFAQHVLGVVILIDVVVLILFDAAALFAKASLNPHTHVSLHHLMHLLVELGSSCAAGVTFGLVTAAWFWLTGDDLRLGVTFCVVSAFAVGAFCNYLHYDTLLVFMTAGFVVHNLSEQGIRLEHAIENLSFGVMILFFATAGASLNLEALVTLWPFALALASARVLVTFGASYWGHAM
ncbi:MAG: cation:proton antiporter, partial [Myxococcota bacterium]